MKSIRKEDLENVYNKHISLDSIEGMDVNGALQVCGELIDASYYIRKEEGVKKAISFLEQLESKDLTDEQRGILYYYFGNAYADLNAFNQTNINSWKSENKEKSIYYYRKSLGNSLDKNTKAQSLVNLANFYDTLGRFVKSVELYQKAIQERAQEYPSYMAQGNKGIALIHYSNLIYDKEHKTYFAYFAYHCLKESLNNSPNNTEERKAFEQYFNKLNKEAIENIKIEDLKLNDFSLGELEEEIEYRKWCLQNCLFLNPLNDLGEYTISAHDVLHLPNMILNINQNHVEFPSFYNQLKQEFVSARYLAYEGMTKIGTKHFSDREVLLINPLDYPRYSLNIEKIKMSFKTLYSIFDKISLFLRLYLSLTYKNKKGKEIRDIDFRKMWYEKGNVKDENVNQNIVSSNNRALQGLFLISKDLLFHHPDRTKDEQIIQDLTLSLEPSAKEINLLRNNLEHGYVKVHENFYKIENDGMFKDKLSYSISESDIKEYVLKLLKLCREALIYLSLGVHLEEIKKESISKGTLPKIKSDIYEDDWKR